MSGQLDGFSRPCEEGGADVAAPHVHEQTAYRDLLRRNRNADIVANQVRVLRW